MATAKIPTSKFLAKGGNMASASMPGGQSTSLSAGKMNLKSPVNKNMPTSKRPPAFKTAGAVTAGKMNLSSKASPGMPVNKKEALSSGGKRSSLGVKSR